MTEKFYLQQRNKAQDEKVERACFVEEQSIRRSLGPSLFRTFCDEIQAECARFNNAVGERLLTSRFPLELTVKDLKTCRFIRFEYDDECPSVHWTESGASGEITFRVDKTPAPFLRLMHNGSPFMAKLLAMEFVVGLTR